MFLPLTLPTLLSLSGERGFRAPSRIEQPSGSPAYKSSIAEPTGLRAAGSAVPIAGHIALTTRQQEPTGRETGATPKGDRSSWFRQKDYPSEAKRNEQRGRVSIRLSIDRKGVPRECSVTGSSGFPSLDQATCNLALERARFYPARVGGKAIEGQYSLSTNWTLIQR